MSKAYEITDEKGQVVIRLDRSLVDYDAISRLLDYAELEAVRKRSQLQESQARELADEIDRAVWDQVKDKYTGR